MLGGAGDDRRDPHRDAERELPQGAPRAHYPGPVRGKNGRVAHELIFDLRPLKAKTGIDETTSPSA
jgi:hypothetical protein